MMRLKGDVRTKIHPGGSIMEGSMFYKVLHYVDTIYIARHLEM